MNEEKLKNVSNNLKLYRNKVGLSVEEVASLLNMSPKDYGEAENNPRKITIETLRKIADILHCNLSDFFMDSKDTINDLLCINKIKGRRNIYE